MLKFKDQTGRTIKIKAQPKRIISIVPSQSEFLWELGLHNELVGITKFCIHPAEMYKSVTRVGGTKKLNISKIRALKPDLIIGNKEENEKSDIELLEKEFNVWLSDIYNLENVFDMMHEVGIIVGKSNESEKMIEALKNEMINLKGYFNNYTFAYFIWCNPYMVAANNTFINFLLNYLGFKNVFIEECRYPIVNIEELKVINPMFCFLSSEPFPFKEKHIKELQLQLPKSKVLMVDGEIFSWYGSRLFHLSSYIKDLKEKMNA